MTDPHPKTRLRPVIRVFVSSTFSDMKHERNALQADVFPKLEQLCLQNGFQFQAIDLRWGISTEAGLDHRTMRICLEELRRSQEVSPEPNFLVMLGDRYGWRPLPEEISPVEFERLVATAESGGENQSSIPGTHGKTAQQVLREWYRCDENVLLSIPPEPAPDRAPLNYILQPRTQNLGDGCDYTRTIEKPPRDTQEWLDVQRVLWNIINLAFPTELLDHRFEHIDWPQHVADVYDKQHPKRSTPQIARFQASATEQEIWCGAFSAPNPERHVLAFFREIENISEFTESKRIEKIKDFVDTQEVGEIDAGLLAQQMRLKGHLCGRLDQANVFTNLQDKYGKVGKPITVRLIPMSDKQAPGTVDVTTDHLEQLCAFLENRLTQIIQVQIEEYWKNTTQNSAERAVRELEIEQAEHERFGRERGGEDSFVGRQAELQAIFDYVRKDSPWPLVVSGASGCGKTALLARAAQEATALKPVVRLIGIHPRSSDLRGLLSSLCQELRLRYPRDGELPTDIKVLEVELHEHFREAVKSEQPLILFLDALDQLADTDGGRLLHWIPSGPLPTHVRLVVSCLSARADGDPAGQPYAELRRRQLPAENFINLHAFSEDEARTVLFDTWLFRAGRTVNQDQRACIEKCLVLADCRQPIYLKLLFEEARLWRSYDLTPKLGTDVPTLIGQLIERLKQPTNHGKLLVERVLGYLAACREGLAENEILDILFRDREYRKALDDATEETHHEMPTNSKRIPVAIWSRLRFDIAPYLTERAATGANVLTFYHRQVAEWVQNDFVKASDHSWQPHRRLAAYFQDVADPNRECRWRGTSLHALRELPYHLILGQMWDELVTVLNDLLFVEATCVAGGAYELVADFDLAVVTMAKHMPEDDHRLRRIQVLANAVGAEVYALNCYPQITGQQIYNRFVQLGEADAKMRNQTLGRAREAERIACLLLSAAYRSDNQERTLLLGVHGGPVQAVSFCPSGDWAASVGFDGRMFLYPLKNRSLPPTEILLSGHLHKVCFAPRYPNVLVSDRHGQLSMVDVISRHKNEVRRVVGPVEEVVVDDMSGACHVLGSDGQIVTITFGTNTVQTQPKPFKSLHADSQCVWLVKPNGLMPNECPKSLVPNIVTRPSFFMGHFRTGELYNFEDRELRVVSEIRHGGGIQTLAEAIDGKILGTLGHDGILRLWRRTRGKWDRTGFELHKVRSFALGLEGQVILGFQDGDVRLIRCTEQAQRAKSAPALFDAWLAIRQSHCDPPSHQKLALEIKSGQLIVRMGSFDKVQTLDYEVTIAVLVEQLPAIVWVSKDGHIRMVKQEQSGQFGSAQTLLRPFGDITGLFYLSGIQRIAVGRQDGSIWLMSSLERKGEEPEVACLEGHSVPISTVYELAEKSLLLSVDRRGLLCVHRLDFQKGNEPCVIQPLGLLQLPSEPQPIDPIRPAGHSGFEFLVGAERTWIWHVQLGGCDIGFVRNIEGDELNLPMTLRISENINKEPSQ